MRAGRRRDRRAPRAARSGRVRRAPAPRPAWSSTTDVLGPHRVRGRATSWSRWRPRGLHSNGYSLVRSVFGAAGWALDRDVPELGRTLGEELLEPTRVYAARPARADPHRRHRRPRPQPRHRRRARGEPGPGAAAGQLRAGGPLDLDPAGRLRGRARARPGAGRPTWSARSTWASGSSRCVPADQADAVVREAAAPTCPPGSWGTSATARPPGSRTAWRSSRAPRASTAARSRSSARTRRPDGRAARAPARSRRPVQLRSTWPHLTQGHRHRAVPASGKGEPRGRGVRWSRRTGPGRPPGERQRSPEAHLPYWS